MSNDPTTEAPRAQRDAQRVKLTPAQERLLRSLPQRQSDYRHRGPHHGTFCALVARGLARGTSRGAGFRREAWIEITAAGRAWLAGEGGGCTMT